MPRASFDESDEGYIFVAMHVLETEADVDAFIDELLAEWNKLAKIRRLKKEEPPAPTKSIPNYVQQLTK